MAAYFIWRIRPVPEALRAFLAGFTGIIVPALLMALEFELSGYGRGIYYLISLYIVAAAIEGILTLVIVGFFRKVDPSMLQAYPFKNPLDHKKEKK